jgi:hypothetical protein
MPLDDGTGGMHDKRSRCHPGSGGSPLFTKGEQELKGSIIAEVTPVNTEGPAEKLILPASPIKKAYQWLKAGEVKEITAG